MRELAQQAFSRAAGAPLIEGNRVRLLKNGEENYPAWLAAIRAAKHYVHFENYIIHDDDVGRMFADALAAKDVKERMATLGFRTLTSSAADFGRLMAAERVKWGAIIRAANLKLD